MLCVCYTQFLKSECDPCVGCIYVWYAMALDTEQGEKKTTEVLQGKDGKKDKKERQKKKRKKNPCIK